jgi:hypothetical protein
LPLEIVIMKIRKQLVLLFLVLFLLVAVSWGRGTGTAQNPELFTAQFTYKGHQYIQISSPVKPSGADSGGGGGGGGVAPEPLPDGVTVNVVGVHEVRTAMPASGTFSASNPLLTQIEKNTRAAIAENYVSRIITDTPRYKKNGWTGDAQLSVPTAALEFDAERQFWKSFQDMADAQEPTGELTLPAPTARGYRHVGQVFKPGYQRIAFRPTIHTGLDHAEASYESVRGKIASSWTKSGSTLTLDVTVPPNAGGLVYVPTSDPGAVTVSDALYAKFVRKDGTRLVYMVDSGSYRFTIKSVTR